MLHVSATLLSQRTLSDLKHLGHLGTVQTVSVASRVYEYRCLHLNCKAWTACDGSLHVLALMHGIAWPSSLPFVRRSAARC